MTLLPACEVGVQPHIIAATGPSPQSVSWLYLEQLLDKVLDLVLGARREVQGYGAVHSCSYHTARAHTTVQEVQYCPVAPPVSS